MSVCESYNLKLASIEDGISECLAKVDSLEKQKPLLAAAAQVGRRKLAYFRLARITRKPSEQYSLWQAGLLLVVAGAGFAAGFIVLDLLSCAAPTSVFFGIVASLAFVSGVGVLFHYPSEAALPAKLHDAETAVYNYESQLREQLETLSQVKTRLESLIAERTHILKSVEWHRAALLNRDWRSLRDEAWENYLVEVFSALGASPRRTGKSGDQGVDIVVEWDECCIAVQAKGYHHTVSNNAVQEAVAGMAHYGCTSSAVITNSRFTAGAVELAKSNRCALVDEFQFPDFVMGKRRL
jgi:hypothetical protein